MEDNMPFSDKSKHWYKSKSIWAGIIIISSNIWDNVLVPNLAQHFEIILPVIPAWIYSMFATLGIYGRVIAKKSVGK